MFPKGLTATKSPGLPRIIGIVVVLVLLSFGLVILVQAQTKRIANNTRIGIIGVPMRINPLWSATNPTDSMITPLVYRGLVSYNEKSEPIGDLADRWEISEDGKVYTVYLKPDQEWQDGKGITADDVVFTYQRTQNEEYTGPEKDRFKGVTIEKKDTYTVGFTLSEKFTPFVESLSLGILPLHIWNSIPLNEMKTTTYNLKPVGSGRYRVTDIDTQHETIQEIDLVSQESAETYSHLVLKFYDEKNTLSTAYKLGEVDGFLTYDPLIARSYLNWENTDYQRISFCGQLLTIFFNRKSDDANVIQSNDFKEALYSTANIAKLDSKATFNPLPSDHWAYADVVQPEITPENQLAEKFSSMAGIEQTIQFVTTQHEIAQQYARILTAQLKQFGVRLNLTVASTEKLQEDTLPNRSFDLLLVQQKLGHDPDQYTFWHSSQTDTTVEGLNASSYASRKVDRALEQGRTADSQEDRLDDYKTFQEELTKDKPALFISNPPLYLISKTSTPTKNFDTCIWEQGDFLMQLTKIEE